LWVGNVEFIRNLSGLIPDFPCWAASRLLDGGVDSGESHHTSSQGGGFATLPFFFGVPPGVLLDPPNPTHPARLAWVFF
jgi:hypothetical protein